MSERIQIQPIQTPEGPLDAQAYAQAEGFTNGPQVPQSAEVNQGAGATNMAAFEASMNAPDLSSNAMPSMDQPMGRFEQEAGHREKLSAQATAKMGELASRSANVVVDTVSSPRLAVRALRTGAGVRHVYHGVKDMAEGGKWNMAKGGAKVAYGAHEARHNAKKFKKARAKQRAERVQEAADFAEELTEA